MLGFVKLEDGFYTDRGWRPSANHTDIYRGNNRMVVSWLKRLGLGPGSRVLSIGIGAGGSDTEFLLNETHLLFGCDVSPKALKLCRQSFPSVLLALASGHALPFPDKSFDFVCFLGVLHHMTGQGLAGYPHKLVHYALDEAHRVLRPNGYVICLEPNMLYPSTLAIYPVNSFMQRVKPGWRNLVPTERNISPWRMQRLLEAHTFTILGYRATTFANEKLPRGLFCWLRKREERYLEHRFLKNFGVFTLMLAGK